TNSGYPLDLNLYQAVKGMRAAERIVKDGGTIILVAECCQGVPAGSPHENLLHSTKNGSELLEQLATPGFVRSEQWQGQIQALIQRRARVLVHSSLSDGAIIKAHLEPCPDLTAAIQNAGPTARIAVLPQGPLTIPILAGRY
ncbi:MAG: hypothetical protein ABI680_13690, partial [Chthoniobacteraceae bacterium]